MTDARSPLRNLQLRRSIPNNPNANPNLNSNLYPNLAPSAAESGVPRPNPTSFVGPGAAAGSSALSVTLIVGTLILIAGAYLMGILCLALPDTVVGAQNGLNYNSTARMVEWGGELLRDTEINQTQFDITFNNNSTQFYSGKEFIPWTGSAGTGFRVLSDPGTGDMVYMGLLNNSQTDNTIQAVLGSVQNDTGLTSFMSLSTNQIILGTIPSSENPPEHYLLLNNETIRFETTDGEFYLADLEENPEPGNFMSRSLYLDDSDRVVWKDVYGDDLNWVFLNTTDPNEDYTLFSYYTPAVPYYNPYTEEYYYDLGAEDDDNLYIGTDDSTWRWDDDSESYSQVFYLSDISNIGNHVVMFVDNPTEVSAYDDDDYTFEFNMIGDSYGDTTLPSNEWQGMFVLKAGGMYEIVTDISLYEGSSDNVLEFGIYSDEDGYNQIGRPGIIVGTNVDTVRTSLQASAIVTARYGDVRIWVEGNGGISAGTQIDVNSRITIKQIGATPALIYY